VAPLDIETPLQIVEFAITAAAGRAYIVTVTGFDLAQPVAVMVSVRVYEVVDAGDTAGFEEVELNPAGLLTHE
jgi:hypothetical protein